MNKLNRQILFIFLFIFSALISQAQNMFFHLLPGFKAPFTWIGLGGNANWDNPANWNTGVVPGVGHVATFDDTCMSNCDPLINLSIDIAGIDIKNTYSGSITQGSGNTITIGSRGWTQMAGVFNGGDSNIIFSGSVLTMTGTSVFNSTTAETYFNQTQASSVTTITASAGTTLIFPNNSTQHFRLQSNCGGIVYGISSPQKISFYNLTTETLNVGCSYANFGNATGTIEIRGDMSHTSGGAKPINFLGTIEFYGNISMASASVNNETWIAKGAASKTYSGPGGIGNFILAKTGGATFTPIDPSQSFYFGSIRIQSGEFTFPQTANLIWKGSSGDFFKIDAGTTVNVPLNSLVNIETWGACGSKDRNIDTNGAFNFEHLSIYGTSTGCGASTVMISGGSSLTVKKDFTIGDGFIANFPISVEGSLSTTGNTYGTMALTATTGNSKTITQATSIITSGTVTVSKPGGTLTASTNLVFNNSGQDMNISNGTVNLAGRQLTVNDILTVGVSGKLICNGGTVTAGSWSVSGEVSCGTSIGITWTGLAGDGLWSTPGNWTNNTIPGASDVAIFNGMCAGAACLAQINSNLSVRGIVLSSTYTGTLTQNSGQSLTVGTAGFNQTGGSFSGGINEITMNGPFTLSGGNFLATTDIIHFNANVSFTGTSIFSHNSGTIYFNSSQSIFPNGVTFNAVKFRGHATAQNLNTGTMIVAGLLTFEDTGNGTLSNGNIEAMGDVLMTSTGKTGNVVLKIKGAGAQSLTAVGGTVFVTAVEINKPGGLLNLIGNIRSSNNWTYTAGTVDAGTSTLSIEGNSTIVPGTMNYNNVTFAGWNTNTTLSNGTMMVIGALILNDVNSGTINNGIIEARGDISVTGYKSGSAIIKINGGGAQSITGNGINAGFPNVNIDKASGTLTMVGLLKTRGNWVYTNGTVDAGTSTLVFDGDTTSVPGPVFYNNITLGGWNNVMNFSGGTFIVTGTLTLSDPSAGTINNGTIEARGDISVTGSKTGTANLTMNGNTSGTLNWTAGTFLTNTLTVAKTGGASLLLGASANFSTAGRNFTINSGVMDLAGYDLNVNNILTVSMGATLKCNGGEFTAGTLSNSGAVNCPGYSTYDFNWTGAGADSNWTTAGNWQGGVAPVASDLVVFQNTYCGATCNSTISVNQTVKGVRIFSPFTGIITQATNAQLIAGSRGYTQAAGTFQGGNDTLNISTKFILTGGLFNATSGTLSYGGLNWNTSAGVFNPGPGLVEFNSAGGSGTINHGTNTFYNLNLFGWAASYATTGTVTVNNDFNFGTGSGSSTSLTGGIFALNGNVTMVNNGLANLTGTTVFKIKGTGVQTITGSGGYVTALEINKPSGTLNLAGTLILNGILNYVAGTVNPGTSTIRFLQKNGTTTHSPNGLTLSHVYFDYVSTGADVSFNNQTLNTTGTVTFNSNFSGSTLSSGVLTISGNAVKSGITPVGGTAQVQFIGSANSTLTPSGVHSFPGNTTINKSGGARVTLAGNTYFNNAGQNLTVMSGTLDMAGFNLIVGNNISNAGTIESGVNPSCGTITQGGSFSGNPAICP